MNAHGQTPLALTLASAEHSDQSPSRGQISAVYVCSTIAHHLCSQFSCIKLPDPPIMSSLCQQNTWQNPPKEHFIRTSVHFLIMSQQLKVKTTVLRVCVSWPGHTNVNTRWAAAAARGQWTLFTRVRNNKSPGINSNSQVIKVNKLLMND